MKRTLLVLITTLITTVVFGQNAFLPFTNISVKEGSKTLKYPFTGGINVPQFSSVDLNLDGIKDLVVFDRDGNKVTCFLNEGTPNTIDYVPALEYASAFPILNDWALMVDYDGDGLEDIFTAIPGGICVYKNKSTLSEGLKFELIKKELIADYGSFTTRLYVSQADIPAIVDVDEDGDLDILAFELGIDTAGDAMYWYKNVSMENYNNRDSLEYVVEKRCWGRFRESYNNCVISLQYPNGNCGLGQRTTIADLTKEEFDQRMINRYKMNDGKHSGSTSLIFDSNGDGNLDVLIGDIGCNNMYLLVNTNTNQEPIMTSVVHNYPTSHPIDITLFPAAFLVDVNNDGKRDLIAAPNSGSDADNTQNILLYLNAGTESNPNFVFETNAFLEEEMIEVGEGAFPHLFDYDGDGKLDLLIGNTGYWTGPSTYTAGIALYKNTGTLSNPAFELITRDFCNLSSLNIYGIAPTTGDLDDDGDKDLIIGALDGTIHYFTNTAAVGAPANFQLTTPFYQNIDVGSNSTPHLSDLNGDGKLDLIIGKRLSSIRYLQDTSNTPGSAQFKLITDSLGKINLKTFSVPSGFSSVYLGDLNNDTHKELVVTNANGKLYLFNNIENNELGAYTLIDSLELNLGRYATFAGVTITFGDLDGDGKKDLVAGAPAGGITIYKNNYTVGVGPNEQKKHLQFNVYPNPASEYLFIDSKMANTKIEKVELYNLIGNLVWSQHIQKLPISINLANFTNGQYLLKIHTAELVKTEKIVIIK